MLHGAPAAVQWQQVYAAPSQASAYRCSEHALEGAAISWVLKLLQHMVTVIHGSVVPTSKQEQHDHCWLPLLLAWVCRIHAATGSWNIASPPASAAQDSGALW